MANCGEEVVDNSLDDVLAVEGEAPGGGVAVPPPRVDVAGAVRHVHLHTGWSNKLPLPLLPLLSNSIMNFI